MASNDESSYLKRGLVALYIYSGSNGWYINAMSLRKAVANVTESAWSVRCSFSFGNDDL